MKQKFTVWPLLLFFYLALLTGCGGNSTPDAAAWNLAPLSAGNVNLIFVASPDLTYQAPGDVSASTANLTTQGLQRSLLMAAFLRQQVLGNKNVTGIYALEPASHLQTAGEYPDMAALETIQQFALINQTTLLGADSTSFTANSYPLNASYAPGPLPSGVAAPLVSCPGCQGLDFNDEGSDNEALATGIVTANVPGFYVFSSPWEVTSALLANLNKLEGYNLDVPVKYSGPNDVYTISIASSGHAALATYNSNVNPPSTYPALLVAVNTPCAATPFSISVTGGSNGAVVPAGTNINETFYMIRHAEAHPVSFWDDGNYLAAGQWRALALPVALSGKISPTQVWSIDPAQVYPESSLIPADPNASYVRAALTSEPYAIANNLPYHLVTSFGLLASNAPQRTDEFFFSGGTFSNQKVLLSWEHDSMPLAVNALLASYFPNGGAPTAPDWQDDDYDSVWTLTLDAQGNLAVDNSQCEGINSAALPVTAPQF